MIIIKNKVTKESFSFWNKAQLAFHLIGSSEIERTDEHNHAFFANLSTKKIMELIQNQDWIMTEKKEEPVDFYSQEELKKTA